jgi:putative ABC transport system permease protein
MLSIAFKMLLHKKSRSISTIVGVATAFFLSAAQIGLLIGWCHTCSAIIRHAGVDVWVMADQNPAFDYGTPIPRGRLYQVRSVPGVAWAETMFMGWMFWRRPDGRVINIELVGIDDGLVGGPWVMTENEPAVVLEPHSVIVDDLYRTQLGVSQIGEEVEIGERRAVVRGISKEVRTLTAAPFVFTSVNSAIQYDVRYRPDEITYVLARCEPGVTPGQLREAIAAETPDGQVLTTSEFVRKTIRYWMMETGLGITVITTAILGLAIGTVIVSQTLYAITNDHLSNYATLLAIGFGRSQLASIVFIQAIVLGVIGITIGSALFGRVSQLTQTTPIPIETTPVIFGAVMAALLGSCIAASFLSVRSIFRLDPVSVFSN